MIEIDVKYANLLMLKLENSKHKSEYVWNSRCCICGDSKKNPKKARLFIYKRFNSLFVKCHNCQYSSSLESFLQRIDNAMYENYIIDRYKTGNDSDEKIKKVLGL